MLTNGIAKLIFFQVMNLVLLRNKFHIVKRNFSVFLNHHSAIHSASGKKVAQFY
jgi:hypothetical protein